MEYTLVVLSFFTREYGEGERNVILKPWCEVIGIYGGIEDEGSCVSITVGDVRLRFSKDSNEASILKNQLSNGLIGRKISILKTGLIERPLLLRLLEKSKVTVRLEETQMTSKNRVSKLTGGNEPPEGETRPPKKLGRRSRLPQKRDERSLEKVDDV